jgi:hypothetical protein
METKVCANCGEIRPITSFKSNLDGSLRRHSCNICLGKRERSRQRIDFLEAFGWKCSCCGEEDPRFLTLDHINNDGNIHREKKNEQQIMYQAKREGWPKDKYQCLCFNCNLGRSVNGGVCPHKCQSKEDYRVQLLATQYNLGRSNVVYNTSNLAARIAGRRTQSQEQRVKFATSVLSSLSPEQLDAISKLYNS